ncbi:hypothetical protein AB3S75_032913 [Citrus x aurantiifolia]
MNGDVDVSSAYNDDEIGIHMEIIVVQAGVEILWMFICWRKSLVLSVIDMMRTCWFVVNLVAQFLYMKTA